MAIDRMDWHSGADNFPKDVPYENGGNHIGYFMEYLYKHGFIPTTEDYAIGEYEKVKNGEVSGLEFLMENCDGKFWDTDTNEEGLKFTNYIYDYYLHNVEDILSHNPYEYSYSNEDYKKIEIWLDAQFSTWLNSGKPLEKGNNSSSKGFFSKFFKRQR